MSASHMQEIPFLHPKVDITDINENGKLYNEAVIEAIRKKLSNSPNGRYTKKQLRDLNLTVNGSPVDIKFSISKQGDNYYAVYKGKKHKKSLGSGSYGSVKLVQDLKTGKWLAIKTMKSSREEYLKNKHASDMEIKNLSKSNQFYAGHTRKDKLQFEIIMELGSGLTVDSITKNRQMPAIGWIDMGLQLLIAIDELHTKHGLLHRDIKSDNMMFDIASKKATPIDLGLAVEVPHGRREVKSEFAGAPAIIAPELWLEFLNNPSEDNCTYNEKTEIYALAYMVASVLGLTVFSYPGFMSTSEFKKRIQDPEARNQIMLLFEKLFEEDPNNRAGFKEAIETLSNIRQVYYEEHLNILSRIKNISYLDAHDYLNSTAKEKREIQLALQSVDLVQLISDDRTSNFDLMKLRHELELLGVTINHQAMRIPENQPVKRKLEQHVEKLEAEDKVIYHAFQIKRSKEEPEDKLSRVREISINTSHSKNNSYANQMKKNIDQIPVYAKHLEFVRISLTEQAEDLAKRKPGDNRITLLKDMAAKLQNNESTSTYGQLLSELNILESNLTEGRKNSLGKFMEKHLGLFRSKTTAVAHHAINKVKSDTGIKKR